MRKYLKQSVDNYKKDRVSVFWLHSIIIFLGAIILFHRLIYNNLSLVGMPQYFLYLDEIIVLVLCGFIFTRKIILNESISWPVFFIPLFIFLLIGIISSAVNTVPLRVLLSQSFLDIKGFLLLFVLLNIKYNKDIVKMYIKTFAVIAAIVFIFGILDYMFTLQLRALLNNDTYIDWRLGIPSVQSLFVHPGKYGWFMTFVSLFFFAFFMTFKKWRFFFLGLAFAIVGSYLSMRTKAVGGLMLALFLGVVLYKDELLEKVKICFLFIMILMFAFCFRYPGLEEHASMTYNRVFPKKSHFYDRGNHTVKYNLKDSRTSLYYTSFRVAKDDFPLGVGFGRYGSWMSRVHYSPIYEEYQMDEVWGLSRSMPNFITDTFWPMILGETGYLGLLFYVITLAIILVNLLRVLYKNSCKYTRCFVLASLMVFAQSLFESIAEPIYVNPPAVYFVFGVFGIAISTVNHRVALEELQESK